MPTDHESIALHVIYPPSDQSRDDVVALLRYYLVRTYAEPQDFGLDLYGWDAAIRRAVEALRAI